MPDPHTVVLFLAGASVLALLAGWLTTRVRFEWGAWLSAVGGLVARLIAALVLGWEAVRGPSPDVD